MGFFWGAILLAARARAEEGKSAYRPIDILPAMNTKRLNFRGYPAVGLLDARNICHAEERGNRLPRPEHRGLRSPWGQLGSSSTPRATNTGWPLIGSFSTRPTTRNEFVGLLLRSLRLFSPPPNRVNGVTYTVTGPLNSTPASPFELN